MTAPVAGARPDAEQVRVRDAYARRGADRRDSWFNGGHLFMVQQREREVLRLLARYGFERLDDTGVERAA